jgi:pilus assembly protein Flp/PilA
MYRWCKKTQVIAEFDSYVKLCEGAVISFISALIDVIWEADMLWEEWLRYIRTRWQIRRSTEEGQGLVEYALILVLVVIIVFIVVALLGPWVGNIYSNVINYL